MEWERLSVSCAWVWLLCFLSVGEMVKGLEPCHFPAIYNFGDSNSDTGGISAAFSAEPQPNGMSFFGHPAGRISDGRLVLDFIAEKLGLPYLHAYLDSLATNFRQGANFATGGSTIRKANEPIYINGVSPISLDVQMMQFEQFKERTSVLYKQAKNPGERAYLPNPDEFSKALYTFDIGQNDLSDGLRKKFSDEKIRASIPDMLDQFSVAIQKLYLQGARIFWIHNTGPIGCLPMFRFYFPGGSGLDKHGCIKYHNGIAVEFNRQLKERVYKWRSQFKDAAFTYVDMYTAKYQLIGDAINQGFKRPREICCGHHSVTTHVWCGQRKTIDGTEIYAGSCGTPSKYISWDGVHYSQAASQWIANRILDGALSDPPVSVAHACRNHR